jgi:hypothetical protein
MPIENLLVLAKRWVRDLERGKRGEAVIADFLTKLGYQPMPIAHYKAHEQNMIYNAERKRETAEKTIFAPDFLVISKDGTEMFFAEVKWKGKKKFLGWINTRDYNKYRKTMRKVQGIGFKIFFYIAEDGSIYVLDSLVSPRNFETVAQPDGLVYVIPQNKLRLCCKGYVPKFQDG